MENDGIYMCIKCWGEEFSPGNCKYDGTPLVLKDGEDLPESIYQLIRKHDSASDDKAGFELVIPNPVLFRQELAGAIEQLLATREKEMKKEMVKQVLALTEWMDITRFLSVHYEVMKVANLRNRIRELASKEGAK